jgi:hypothetical protein
LVVISLYKIRYGRVLSFAGASLLSERKPGMFGRGFKIKKIAAIRMISTANRARPK